MKLKTFEAASMAEALAQVKRELGPQAVILHTRTFKRGGLLGLGARTVVEITAADETALGRPARRPGRQAGRSGGGAATGAALLARVYGSAGPAALGPVGRTAATGRRSVTTAATDGIGRMGQAGRDGGPCAGPSRVEQQLAGELRQIRRMVSAVLQHQGPRAKADLPEQLFQQYLHLLEQEVTAELAEEVITKVRQRLTESQMQDPVCVKEAVRVAIARLVPTDGGDQMPRRHEDGRPWTIALIGPTGVGKTTTLAKLAANFKLRHGMKVALVTIDTYRIAAVDQLKTYADILHVPLEVVLTPLEMTEAMKRCRGADVVLIDTAGRSPRDEQKLEQLRAFLQAAGPDEVHLVLSANAGQKAMMEAVERFASLRTDRIIFTKLDEAVSFGVLLNVMRRVNKQLSYVTDGQDVPHHIEAGRPRRLAELIVGEDA